MNKILSLFLVTLLLVSCKEKTTNNPSPKSESNNSNHVISDFQKIIDREKLTGCILILDVASGQYYSNDFDLAKEGHLPASTFKIPNSIIGLELGLLKDENTLFKWDSLKRAAKVWEADLVLSEAFKLSCVPCYQEMARNIGVVQMNKKLAELTYGQMDVDSTTIDDFWLKGSSKITAFQQIDFLWRMLHQQLKISDSTYQTMRRIMEIEVTGTYKLSGKTGWYEVNDSDHGWFVGFIEKGESTYIIATHLDRPENTDVNAFYLGRKDLSLEACRIMNFID